MLPFDLHFFHASEFNHPERVDAEAAYFLDAVRALYDSPIVVTDDARTVEEVRQRQNTLQGGSPSSLHASGRAFDLRFPPTEQLAFRLVRAVAQVELDPKYNSRIELEIDETEGNRHFHIGLREIGSHAGSTLMVRKIK